MYWSYWCLLIFFNTIQLSQEFVDSAKPIVKVGAIFFKDEEDIELAFDKAFQDLNAQKLFELQFDPIKRYMPNDDSLLLQELTCGLLSQEVVAIFGPSSKASTDIVALIANAAGIIHMQYDWDLIVDLKQRLENHKMSVNVAPALPTVSRAYLDIIKTSYKWQKFTLIYETPQGLARIQDLMNLRFLDKEDIKIKNIADYQDDIRALWKEIETDYHEQRLILDCRPESLVPLMNAAKDFNLLGPFKNWFLTHMDSHNSGLQQAYNADFMSNITAVRLKVFEPSPFERKKTRITEVDQILGNQTMLPILMYDAVVLFANAARNIIANLQNYIPPSGGCDVPSEWFLGKRIVDEIKQISEDDIDPPLKTVNLKIDEAGLRTHFEVEIYKPSIVKPLATWTPDGSILPVRHELQISAASESAQDFSLGRKVFTVVTHYEEPYFMMKKDHENLRGREKYEGYAVDLIQKLSGLMGQFDFEFLIVNGNGKLDPSTKKWDGIMQALTEHQAQIGICDLTITQLRRKYVDFSVPFMPLGISILFYKSDPEVKNIFAFLQPFADEVWMYVIMTQLVITLTFVFLARISHDEWENPNPLVEEPDELENKWRTRNTGWLMIGSILQQGCDILPRGAAMRMLTAMWWFFALMMLSTYTANLAAVLTSNKIKPTIKSLDDLIEQSEIKYGTLEGGSTSLFFSESNETNYHKAWVQMKSFEPSAFTKSNKEGVDRVLKEKGKYAFLMETTSLSYNIAKSCHLQQIGNQIGEKHYGLAMPLSSDYRKNLSVSILRLSEKGELYKLKRKWWADNGRNCEEEEVVDDGNELSLIELGGVFLVLAGGVVVAIIIGIMEFLWNVQKVAVNEKVTPGEAFKAELIFALKFWKTKKPNHISSSKNNSDGSASRVSRSTSRRSSTQSKQSKHSKHSKVSKRSKRSKRSRSRSKSNTKIYSTSF